MKNKIKYREIGGLFVVNLILIFIAYYMFFWRSMTNDSVTGYAVNGTIVHFTLDDVRAWFGGGRWLSGIITYLLACIKFDQLNIQWVAQLVKELICAYIPVRLTWLFRKKEWSKKKILCTDLLFLMCTLNVYIEEMFAYNTLEVGIGWILAVEAAVLFTRSHYIASSIVTFLTIGIYQSNFSVVIIIGLAWLIYENGFVYSKDIFKKCLYLAVVVAVPALISIKMPSLAVQLGWAEYVVKETVWEGAVNLSTNITRMCGFIFAFLFASAQGMMPYGMVFVYILGLYVIYWLEMRHRREKTGRMVLTLLYVTLFFAACYVIGLVQALVSLPPRVVYGVFFAIALLAFLVYNYVKTAMYKKILLTGTIVFEVVLFGCVYISGVDHWVSNQLDITYAQQVQNEIDAYEETSGYKVEEMDFYYYREDESSKIAYSNYMIHHYFVQSYNNSVFSTSWGAEAMVEWLSGRDYIAHEMTEQEYQDAFGQTEWKELDLNKQIRFEENKMYWTIYLN